MNIQFSKVSNIGNESKYANAVLKKGRRSNASEASRFEQSFVQYVDGEYADITRSSNAALHNAVEAAGIGPDDKVLVPTRTFISSVDVLLEIGADPVFFDVDCNTGIVSPFILNKALKDHPDVKAIILVNNAEQAEQMKVVGGEGILDLCQRFNIKIIEEATHQFPTKIGDLFLGSSFGDITNLEL